MNSIIFTFTGELYCICDDLEIFIISGEQRQRITACTVVLLCDPWGKFKNSVRAQYCSPCASVSIVLFLLLGLHQLAISVLEDSMRPSSVPLTFSTSIFYLSILILLFNGSRFPLIYTYQYSNHYRWMVRHRLILSRSPCVLAPVTTQELTYKTSQIFVYHWLSWCFKGWQIARLVHINLCSLVYIICLSLLLKMLVYRAGECGIETANVSLDTVQKSALISFLTGNSFSIVGGGGSSKNFLLTKLLQYAPR